MTFTILIAIAWSCNDIQPMAQIQSCIDKYKYKQLPASCIEQGNYPYTQITPYRAS